MDIGCRVDLLDEGALIVELKAVDARRDSHDAQRLACMKIAGIRTGLPLKIIVRRLQEDIQRFVLQSEALGPSGPPSNLRCPTMPCESPSPFVLLMSFVAGPFQRPRPDSRE